MSDLSTVTSADGTTIAYEKFGSGPAIIVISNVAAVDHPGTKMARIAVRPSWVGVLDFRTRLPGGTAPDEFERRGRS